MKINIKEKLKEKNISRYELANRIGVTYPTIDKIYKGKTTSIKFEVLEALCKELNCSPNDILVFDNSQIQPLLIQSKAENLDNKNTEQSPKRKTPKILSTDTFENINIAADTGKKL